MHVGQTTADPHTLQFIQTSFACSPEVAGAIAARAARRSWPVRATLIHQGDRTGATLLLIEGRAHALLVGLEGQLVLVREFTPGDLFGAIAELAPEPHPSDVVAVEACGAAVFTAADFIALIEAHSCVGLAVSRRLLRQLHDATARLVERTTLSAAGRIHAELLRLARAGDGRCIRPAPVLSTLAVRVQTTRETVSRTVGALERRGLIRRTPDELVLVSPRRLEELVI